MEIEQSKVKARTSEVYETFRDWITGCEVGDIDGYSVTLTFSDRGLSEIWKMASQRPGNVLEDKLLRIMEIRLCHYLRRVDVECFGKGACRRHNLRVKRIPVLEGDGQKIRYHFHIAVEKPSFLTDKIFVEILTKADFWKVGRIHVAKDLQKDWKRYITKERDKDNAMESFTDCILIEEVVM